MGDSPEESREACILGTPSHRSGAALGMHELRSLMDPETAYDNNAYTVTSTYHGGSGTLTVYTTHPTPSKNPKSPTEYRMTQLNSFAVTGNLDTFRQGASALRNARDWAKEKREELIAAANGKALNVKHPGLDSSTQSFVSLSSDEPANLESETSADELALGTNTIATSDHRTLVGVRTNPPPEVSSNRRLKKKPFKSNKGLPHAVEVYKGQKTVVFWARKACLSLQNERPIWYRSPQGVRDQLDCFCDSKIFAKRPDIQSTQEGEFGWDDTEPTR